VASGEESVNRFSEVADVVLMRYRLGPDAGMEFVSPSSLAILGYSPEEFYASPSLGLEIVHPGDRDRLAEEYERDPEASFVGRGIRKDGTVRWFERRQAVVVEGDTGTTYLEATLRDITAQRDVMEALRDSRLRFSTAFARAPIGMAIVALDGGWLEVNDAFCEFLGYSEDELRATTWQALTHPADVDADLASVQAAIDGRIDGYTMVKRYVRKDDEEVAGRLTVALVRAPDGEPRYFISQVEPVSDKRGAFPLPAKGAAAKENGHPALTARQIEILQLLADGESTGQIAERLHLSQATVRNHFARALGSLGVHTRVQAIVAASRLGLVRLPERD
jgi:PAS domain S-box-containing protein